jgi:hypothetical protein
LVEVGAGLFWMAQYYVIHNWMVQQWNQCLLYFTN